MDDEIKIMLNTILDKMGRMEERIDKRMDKHFDAVDEHFDKIENRSEITQHEINACKLERESIGLLIKKIDQMENVLRNLKRKQHNGIYAM